MNPVIEAMKSANPAPALAKPPAAEPAPAPPAVAPVWASDLIALLEATGTGQAYLAIIAEARAAHFEDYERMHLPTSDPQRHLSAKAALKILCAREDVPELTKAKARAICRTGRYAPPEVGRKLRDSHVPMPPPNAAPVEDAVADDDDGPVPAPPPPPEPPGVMDLKKALTFDPREEVGEVFPAPGADEGPGKEVFPAPAGATRAAAKPVPPAKPSRAARAASGKPFSVPPPPPAAPEGPAPAAEPEPEPEPAAV